MNLLLWVVQGVLAFLFFAGGAFKASNPAELSKQTPVVPIGAWRALGGFEVVGAVLLIVPGAAGWMPGLTPLAAGALGIETLALAAVYARASLNPAPTNPLVFALPMGLLSVLVAWGRWVLETPGGA